MKDGNWLTKSRIYVGGMVLFDIFAVNFAYWFALIARFFIGFEFRAGAEQYVTTLERILPFYTVAAIVIFVAFKLYKTMWKVAGVRDLNNIILANLCTAVVFVVGSLVTGNRMPLTIYFIGPVLQLGIIGISRLGIKLYLLERDQIRRRNSSKINAMVVGIKYIGRTAREQIDHSETMVTRCVVDTRNSEKGRMYDGVPVIGGTDGIRDAIEKYQINYVMIADSFLSSEKRQEIRNICAEKSIDILDMTGYIENGSDSLSLVGLMQAVDGPVTLVINGKEQSFQGNEAAMCSVSKHYIVKRVTAKNKTVVIELTDNPLIPNDTNEAWVNEYKKETGSDVSFF